MESNKGRGSLIRRYLAALLAPAVIAGAMQVTWPLSEHNPVQPYLLAVIFCSWYGGLGPGLLSLVISFLLTDFFFIEPYFSFGFPKQVDVVRLLLLAIIGPFICVMTELMHRERRRAEINLESAKRAEGLLRAKERFANQIAELSPVVINVFDLGTMRDVYLSPDVANLLGYTPKEIAEMEDPFSVLWHPEDIPRANKNLALLKHLRDGEIAEFEYRMRRRDGEWRWVASRIIPFERDEHGVVRQVVAASLDITERKRAEDALSQLSAIVESSDDAIIGKTVDGLITSWNKGAEKLYGYTPEEMIGQPVTILAPPDRSDEMPNILVRLRRGNQVEHFETERVAKDGRRLHISLTVSVIKNPAGQVVGVSTIARDITERYLADEQIKRSQRQLAEAQHMARIGSWNWDLQSNALNWSDELYRIFGVDPQAFNPAYENFVMEFVRAEDRTLVRDVVESALKAQEPYSFYNHILRPDGEERVIHVRGDTVSDEHGNPVRMFGTAQDVTERKQAEGRLRATTEQLRALSARIQSAKEEEGTRIAREIHDELGGALTSLRWDLESFDKVISESEGQSQLQVLRERIESMLRLTETTIGTVRRISSELRPSALDDLGLVLAIEWQARQFQARTGIICRCDCSLENLDLDREQSTAAFRIFQEALTNILRHAQATRVDITMEGEDREFVLTISDNGRGITETEKSRSQSLGLLGMQERAYLTGGSIKISGFDGKGTVVTLRIPISG